MSKDSAPVGQRAYEAREATGKAWQDIAAEIGYRTGEEGAGPALMQVARGWAKSNGKPWPVGSGENGAAEADTGEKAGEAMTQVEWLELKAEAVALRAKVDDQGKAIHILIEALKKQQTTVQELVDMLTPQIAKFREERWTYEARLRVAAESKPLDPSWAVW